MKKRLLVTGLGGAAWACALLESRRANRRALAAQKTRLAAIRKYNDALFVLGKANAIMMEALRD